MDNIESLNTSANNSNDTNVWNQMDNETPNKLVNQAVDTESQEDTSSMSPEIPNEVGNTTLDAAVDVLKNNLGSYSFVLENVNKAHTDLIGNITRAKEAHDGLRETVGSLKEKIENLQKERESLKQSLLQASQQYKETISFSEVEDELRVGYEDIKGKSCIKIATHSNQISSRVSSDFDSCFPLIDALDQEVELLKLRMRNASILKALVANMQLYKELMDKKKKVEERFQTLADIFRLDIDKN